MIQSKNHDLHNRPSNKTSAHTNSHDYKHEHFGDKKCGCGEDCKCGCQEGKPCTCGSTCGCCASGVASGIFGLISACIICGSVLYASTHIESALRAQIRKPAQRPDMNGVISTYIKDHPAEIVASLEAYGRKQQKAQPQAPREAKAVDAKMLAEIVGDKTNNVLGNPKGSFVIVEFFDYNCGFCKRMNKSMAEAVKKSDNIRWILMDAPIFGEKSEIISRYAYAAGKQGKFAEYHAALGDAADRSEEGLKAIGKNLGLNVEKLAKDAASSEVKAKLAKTREYTTKLGLTGVPMFIIDGKIQTGAFSDELMEEYIAKANAMKRNTRKK